MPNTIIVEAHQDRMGNVHVRPVSDKWAERFRDTVVANGGPDELTAFFQEHHGDAFIEEDIPPRYRNDIREGWTVRFKADPWTVGHWYGYDACNADIS